MTDHEKKVNNNWLANYYILVAYKDEFGCFPPARAVYKNVKIGVWLRSQIRAYNNGKLSEDRERLLTDLGYAFDSPIDARAEFDRKLALLLEYKAEFGKFPPAGTVYKNERIGFFAANLRKAYKQGHLSQDRIDCLLAKGFVFSVRESEFDRKLALLLEYKAEHGRFPGDKEMYKNEAVGNWFSKQRTLYRKNKMPKNRQIKFAKAGISLE